MSRAGHRDGLAPGAAFCADATAKIVPMTDAPLISPKLRDRSMRPETGRLRWRWRGDRT
jgi:hypothetical protein